jgi:DNA-binding transcriptional LysR family regulator
VLADGCLAVCEVYTERAVSGDIAVLPLIRRANLRNGLVRRPCSATQFNDGHSRYVSFNPAMDALTANAGFAMCGIALLREAIETGRLSLPFPVQCGRRTAHAFQARFRADTLQRPQVRRFRQWLLDEGSLTRQWLDEFIGGQAV